MGTPASGIHSHTRGWDIGANVRVFDEDGEDVCYIGISGGSNNGACLAYVTVKRNRDGSLAIINQNWSGLA